MVKLPDPVTAYFGWDATGDYGPWTFYTDKRRGIVFFLKAPPKTPPTDRQIYQRLLFREAARLWSNLTDDVRLNWTTAANRASLAITGYNLWIYYQLSHDRPTIHTIEHQTNIQLL